MKIRISQRKIARALAVIPRGDFAHAQFDTPAAPGLRHLIVILSTPRSGSTLLCDLFRINDICVPHEYFQSQEYLPLLADRWGCINGDRLDLRAYVEALVAHRTSAEGVLGINLHGAHIPIFREVEGMFGAVPVHFVVVRRRDTILQAISYEIAGQTRRWSSAFEADRAPEYSFERILDRTRNLVHQNLLIDASLRSLGIAPVEIVYEDLIADPAAQLRRLDALRGLEISLTETGLEKQASSINENWAQRFANDLLKRPSLRMAQGRRGWLAHAKGLIDRLGRWRG